MAVRPILLALVLLSFTLTGCSGGDSGDGDDDSSSTPSVTVSASASVTASASPSSTSASSTTPPPAPQTVQKDITDNSFPDGTFPLRVGDTVVWTHRGSNPHSVSSDGFDSSPNCQFATSALSCMQGGATFTHKFDAAGSFDYHCKIHASMTGTITVT